MCLAGCTTTTGSRKLLHEARWSFCGRQLLLPEIELGSADLQEGKTGVEASSFSCSKKNTVFSL
jgi:hypothetical protein